MPTRAKAICRVAACGTAIDRPGYCEQHKRLASGWNREERKSSTARGYGQAWQAIRETVLYRDYGLCQPCHREGTLTLASAVDHIIPKQQGGTDDLSNLQAICNECHKAKTQSEAHAARGQGVGGSER